MWFSHRAHPGIPGKLDFNFGGINQLKLPGLSRSDCFHGLKKTFVFTGGEIVNEFLMSTGYLAGAHEEGCPIFKRVASLRPAWMRR